MSIPLKQKITAEFLGSAVLLMAIVGSGVMGARLSDNHQALTLLVNSLTTGFSLFFLILSFSKISGSHFNPLVSLLELVDNKLSFNDFICYVIAQLLGAVVGVLIVHLMFGLDLVSYYATSRAGFGLYLSEYMATFFLILVIFQSKKMDTFVIAMCVATYIAAAYWFTSSTSFANPAVTFARSFTSSFSGIGVTDVGSYVAFQVLGAFSGYYLVKWLNKNA